MFTVNQALKKFIEVEYRKDARTGKIGFALDYTDYLSDASALYYENEAKYEMVLMIGEIDDVYKKDPDINTMRLGLRLLQAVDLLKAAKCEHERCDLETRIQILTKNLYRDSRARKNYDPESLLRLTTYEFVNGVRNCISYDLNEYISIIKEVVGYCEPLYAYLETEFYNTYSASLLQVVLREMTEIKSVIKTDT